MDAAIREFVRQRAGNRCEYCRLPEEVDAWPFHLEHVVSKQHGGNDEPDNLCWACSRCNLYKGPNLSSLDPVTGILAALFHPRTQMWDDHFKLVGSEIEGVSPTGRTTSRLMHMNDSRRQDLRAALIRRGVFPA